MVTISSKIADVPNRVRLVELTAALSLATDLGTGQPLEHALRTSVLALRAADGLGLSMSERSAVLYTTLLRFLGCTADASESAVLAGGDEIEFNALMAPVVMGDDREGLSQLVRHLGEGLPLPRRLGRIGAALTDPGGKARTLSAHCEVGARLTTRLGLPLEVTTAVGHAYERWDGKGLPAGLAGDAIPVATRIAIVARDVDVWCNGQGWERTRTMLARRRDRAYDPTVVDVFAADGATWLAELEAIDPWDAVLDAEPAPFVLVDDARLDDVLAAFADFADLKSPWFVGHSRAVSELAGSAAALCGLEAAEVSAVRRGGLVHDLGIVGVPSGVWNRTGPLTAEGWERVRLHPHLGERVLRRCAALDALADLAGAHHERSDGSGYHRGTHDLTLAAQLVAAADVYQALTEDRPHRSARTPDGARQVLTEETDTGRFSRRATDAVLAAAGHGSSVPHVERPAGLTEREVDVLRLIARGRSNKDAARDLGISAKTIGSHVEHIYAKAGVTTRAGATLFAMEHDLIRT